MNNMQLDDTCCWAAEIHFILWSRFTHCSPRARAWLNTTLQMVLVRLNDGAKKTFKLREGGSGEKAASQTYRFHRGPMSRPFQRARAERGGSYRDEDICSTLWWIGQKLREDTRGGHQRQGFHIDDELSSVPDSWMCQHTEKDTFLHSSRFISGLWICSINTGLLWKDSAGEKQGENNNWSVLQRRIPSCSSQKDHFEVILPDVLWEICPGSPLEALHLYCKWLKEVLKSRLFSKVRVQTDAGPVASVSLCIRAHAGLILTYKYKTLPLLVKGRQRGGNFTCDERRAFPKLAKRP